MRIKRLELVGFKSFFDKVALDFQPGVTGVVGPNGCGKSNIVDAIRWCMGEQSAKNLRGKAMEDVIFAGSESRKSLGMAEVSLIFSTEDGRAPAKYLDYAEIQLTRRLYRDGESDYLINKTPCRLLDITELFMDTGVGTRAYSIIEQGKIGMILHSRPEERRFLIEEAAGVTKFKSRKLLALKKIEATRQNLSRLVDVLGEIRRQLTSLQRQAKKAEKFREYRDELREIELLFAADDYRLLQQQRSAVERDLADLNERIREVFASSSLNESLAEEARLQLLEAEKNLGIAQEDIYRIKSEYAKAENGLEFQRKELAGLGERMSRLSAEAGEMEKRLAECAEQRGILMLRLETFAGVEAVNAEESRQAEIELDAHHQAEEALNRMLESRRGELFAALAESARLKSRCEDARKQLANLMERIERHGREGMQLLERREQIRLRSVGLDAELATARQEQERLRLEMAGLHQKDDELKKRLPDIEKNWQSRRDELNLASSRLQSMKELEARFAGYGQGVKNLMKASGLRSRFSGLLADIIDTQEGMEAAVEAALSERLQCVLCNDEADVMSALEFLKTGNGGRAGLALPPFATPRPVPSVAGATPLAGLVRVTGRFEGVVGCILNGVMLVDELKHAIELARKHPELSFVTREGELVNSGGVVFGGSVDHAQQGIISKKREIKELEARVVTLGQEVASLNSQRDDLRRQSMMVADGLKTAVALLHQSDLKLTALQKDCQQATDETSRIAERLALQTLENTTLHEEKEALEAELKLSQARITESGDSSQGLEQEVNRLKMEQDTLREKLAVSRERVTAIRVRTATMKEQHETHMRGLDDLDQRSREFAKRMASCREEMEKGAVARIQLEESINTAGKLLEELILRQAQSENRLTEIRNACEFAGNTLTDAEARAKQSRETNETVRQSQADITLRFSTLSMQAEHMERTMLERSRISMADALTRLDAATEFDRSRRQTRRTELQRLLDEMGEVNLMAIDECAGMEERFNFLNSQKEDLEESLRSLQQAIQCINRTTRQRFQETYNQVNAKFQEVFPRLFCGGHAEMRLTDEEDLLETGIDIIAQPPGKKLQSVTLLSGGEKALTAVALIFSIFLIKPTPFCLLDEVDAPLDDANIGRFNEMVREMSAVSQFIIITHNKATMQVADTLYGITMEEPGVSKVVSVRLH